MITIQFIDIQIDRPGAYLLLYIYHTDPDILKVLVLLLETFIMLDTFNLTPLAPISLFSHVKRAQISHHKGAHVHYPASKCIL